MIATEGEKVRLPRFVKPSEAVGHGTNSRDEESTQSSYRWDSQSPTLFTKSVKRMGHGALLGELPFTHNGQPEGWPLCLELQKQQ
jgi:hypothetical protein